MVKLFEEHGVSIDFDDANVVIEKFEQEEFDLGICIGSTRALGRLELHNIKRSVSK